MPNPTTCWPSLMSSISSTTSGTNSIALLSPSAGSKALLIAAYASDDLREEVLIADMEGGDASSCNRSTSRW
eukprot:CAMPEP_0179417182 /NCGR_PEP_ID=MMETSP0799-20121207/7226_1 /TAXON_ID=46947 /ORGANISM="Geminigera cryophila, Strain CCMP2564" /LENGTH=71 /DNA_ID=CAMNT_0021190165 /DNA_START=137 /DNA_END=349 /DNA_ORIENTATION=-